MVHPQPLFTGTAGWGKGEGMIVLVAQGCRRFGVRSINQAGGWLPQFRGLTLGLDLPRLPLVHIWALFLVLCSVQLLAWKPFYAAAVVGPAAWPRCLVAACRPVSGIPAAGNMLLGSGKPGPGVPTQYGSSLQLSGSPPKSGPVGRDGSYTYNLALPVLSDR